MNYIKKFNEIYSTLSMCKKITEDEYNSYWRGNKNITKPISDNFYKLVINEIKKIESFYGAKFLEDKLEIKNIKNEWGLNYYLTYYRTFNNPPFVNSLYIRFCELDDDYYLIEYNDHTVSSFYFICDQDHGIKEFGDMIIKLVKAEYIKYKLILPQGN